MRLFIAIDLPENIIAYVRYLQEFLRAMDLFKGSYVRPEQVHITTAFLDERAESDVPAIIDQLKRLKGEFDITLDGISVDSLRHPRVIWIDIQSEGLASANHFLPNNERAFKAHLTLARIRLLDDREALLKALTILPVKQLTMSVNALTLKKSELTPDGSVYTDLYKHMLS